MIEFDIYDKLLKSKLIKIISKINFYLDFSFNIIDMTTSEKVASLRNGNFQFHFQLNSEVFSFQRTYMDRFTN